MGKDRVEIEYKEWKQNEKRKRNKYISLCVIGLMVFILLWQFLIQFKLIPSRNMVAFSEVVKTLIYKLNHAEPEGNTLFVNIIASLKVALSGFMLAIVIGVPLGLFMGWYKPIDKLVRPIFELIRPIPPIAWIPVIIMWLGIGLQAKAFIIFLTSFVACTINSYTGIKLTNKTLINVAKTSGASEWQTFITVGIPSSLPLVFSGIRIALGTAWSTLVAAEMLASNAGLGYMIQMGRNFSRADVVLAGMVVIGAIGAIMSGILSLVERKVLAYKIRH